MSSQNHIAVRIVSPAGHIAPEIIEAGAKTLRTWGWEVSLGKYAFGKYGRYAGTPEQRAADLHDALRSPEIDVIWCARGGYGCMQLLDLLSIEEIANARKCLIGYSDITVLHALWQKAGVSSVHGPMMKHLGEQPQHPSTLMLKAWIEQHKNDRHIASPRLEIPSHPLNIPGKVTGVLIGGNLAVLSALHATPYDFNYDGKILFIEDIAESPYKIDRMMQTLKYSGILQKISGLLIGQFTDCSEDPEMQGSIYENIRSIVAPFGKPVAFNVPIGHVVDNYPMGEGMRYRIEVQCGDNETKTIIDTI